MSTYLVCKLIHFDSSQQSRIQIPSASKTKINEDLFLKYFGVWPFQISEICYLTDKQRLVFLTYWNKISYHRERTKVTIKNFDIKASIKKSVPSCKLRHIFHPKESLNIFWSINWNILSRKVSSKRWFWPWQISDIFCNIGENLNLSLSCLFSHDLNYIPQTEIDKW